MLAKSMQNQRFQNFLDTLILLFLFIGSNICKISYQSQRNKILKQRMFKISDSTNNDLIRYPNENSIPEPSIISANSQSEGLKQLLDKPVSILKVVKNHQSFNLVYQIDKKTGEPSKNYFEDVVAFGSLCGVNESGSIVKVDGIFQGNFVGAFQYEIDKANRKIVYFEGKILKIQKQIPVYERKTQLQSFGLQKSKEYSQTSLQPDNTRILRPNDENLSSQEIGLTKLSYFRGVFKGTFHKIDNFNKMNLDESQDISSIIEIISNGKELDLNEYLSLKSLKDQKEKGDQTVNYYIPAMVTFQLGKITEINLEKSAADISGTLNIDIRLNQEIIDLLQTNKAQYQKKQFEKLTYQQKLTTLISKIKKNFELTIDFHRGRLMNLPFYDVDEDQDQKQDIEDEWAEIWECIDLIIQWNEEKMIMSYKITSIFTAQIDNSYGIFYSPFNLNNIKMVIDFHAIKLGKNKININCCDLTDSCNNGVYKPYTDFTDLDVHKDDQNKKQIGAMFRKHFDRRSKINIEKFIDQGQFKLADNKVTLFPYYKRVFGNSATLTGNYSWSLGLANRSALIDLPEVKDIKRRFQDAFAEPTKKYQDFEFSNWEFVHVEIPIFKYAVIDMIRIFVPIIILSIISLLIFVQENAKDVNGFTTLARRIASGCSLMIAYVALVPMIRSNLPPTPSVTLIQILIYTSTIPNFLAIISNLLTNFIDYRDFFDNYRIFTDGLYITSFVISVFSFIILVILTSIFALKPYQSDFYFNKIDYATVNQMRSPLFNHFLSKVQALRKQYTLQEYPLPRIGEL